MDSVPEGQPRPGSRYWFADFELDPAGPTLRRGGQEIHLRHKTFGVLRVLVEQRHRSVSKQELWNDLWPDSSVTDDALVQCVKDIRRALNDDVREPRFIRTVPRVGYRFIADVREETSAFIPTPLEEAQPVRREAGPRRPWPGRLLAGAAAILLLLVIGAPTYPVRATPDTSLDAVTAVPGRRAVMVMYLENESQDQELDWLRQGLADMLITGLTRSPGLTVIGRQHLDVLMKRHVGKPGQRLPLDRALDMARTTGAQTLVLGTFGRLGARLRVDVQMYDAASAALTGSDRLVADRQEQILTEIDLLSMRLALQLGAGSQARASLPDVMTDDLEAYRHYSLGVERTSGLQNVEALESFREAVRLDPGFAMAHARIGYTYAVSWGRLEEAKPYLEKAFALSTRLTPKDRLSIAAWYSIANLDFEGAITIYRQLLAAHPADPELYVRLAKLLLGERKFDEAMQIAAAGLAVDPSAPELHNVRTAIYFDSGQYAASLEAAKRQVQLAPREPNAHDTLGLQQLATGDYPAAEASFRTALDINPRFEIARVHLANTFVRQGRYAEAAAEFQRYIDSAPSDSERSRGLGSLAYLARRLGNAAEARHLDQQLSAMLQDYIPLAEVLDAFRRGDQSIVERKRAELERRRETNRGTRGNPRGRLFEMGTLEWALGHRDEALAAFRELAAAPPLAWDIDDLDTSLADLLRKLGAHAEAAAEYEKVLRRNPNDALARYGLALTYAEMGARDSAARQFRSFLEIWTGADRNIPEIAAAEHWVRANRGNAAGSH